MVAAVDSRRTEYPQSLMWFLTKKQYDSFVFWPYSSREKMPESQKAKQSHPITSQGSDEL